MRRACVLVLGVSLLGWAVSPASAQQSGQGRRAFGGQAGLLLNSSVQKELNLTEEQTTKIKDAVKQVRDKHKDELEKLRGLSREERREQREQNAKLFQAISEETNKALAGVLKPEQETRLKQITLQTSGARAFQNPEVQKSLKLTDDQKAKIKTIGEDAGKEMREVFRNAGGDFKAAGEKMTALRKETMEKVQNVLTSEQKKTWKDMTGKPFEIKVEFRGRGRRGAGG